MPRRKGKKYTKPKTPFDKVRIEEENVLVKKYGLKNKKEIWKADSAIDKIRRQAKLLLTKEPEEQKKFIEKLQKQGFKVKNIAEVLSLNKENYLKRRFQSVVVEKGLASTARQARQFIVHKHIAIDKNIVNVPSYLVPVDKEDKISLRLVKKIKEEKQKIPEVKTKPEVKPEGAENA